MHISHGMIKESDEEIFAEKVSRVENSMTFGESTFVYDVFRRLKVTSKSDIKLNDFPNLRLNYFYVLINSFI